MAARGSRKPRQERSRSTVGYILEAATRILSEDGAVRMTTNRVAELAGVAVASLYQYFPNKEAIVGALFEQELADEQAEFTQRSGELADASITEIIRGGIRSAIAVHARRPRLVKSLLEVPFLGGREALARARQEVADRIAEAMRARRGELRAAKDVAIRAFLIVHAVEGAIHAAAAERPEYLTDPAFADELVELVERFVVER